MYFTENETYFLSIAIPSFEFILFVKAQILMSGDYIGILLPANDISDDVSKIIFFLLLFDRTMLLLSLVLIVKFH